MGDVITTLAISGLLNVFRKLSTGVGRAQGACAWKTIEVHLKLDSKHVPEIGGLQLKSLQQVLIVGLGKQWSATVATLC